MSVKREGCVTTREQPDGVSVITHASEEAAIEYAASVTAVVPEPSAEPKAAVEPAAKAVKAKRK